VESSPDVIPQLFIWEYVMSEENMQSESEARTIDISLGDLVVVGSSAGGVEALSILVGSLPTDFPAPIVLAQHLDPNKPSSLDGILQRRTPLPVELVTSSIQMERGKIYVVPSNRLVSIRDGHVEVQEDAHTHTRPRPSVDLLLSSAATAYGDRLIAVILTGSGSDGAIGAVDVKNAGGTVIVQDPKTARYPSMPMALPPTVIDFEVDLENIGSLLYDLLTGVSLPRAEEKTDDVLHSILEQVNRQASIDFRPYKTSTILRRIGRRMTITRNRTMQEYSEYLRSHPEEIGDLVKSFLINVTQFFRDPDAFAYLKSDILPRLIAQAHERDRVLRFWTAGCASGEELYSLAMLLTDLLGAELPEWSIKIFATDLDEAAINFARRGLYSENLLKGIPAEYRDRFFERADHGYRISKTLRQMVIFGQQDLSRSAPFPRIDLVLCRNVLIYFTPELQEFVLSQFAFSLSPGGYLFLGKAETVRPTQSYYELVNKHWKMYRCMGNSLPMPTRQGLTDLNTKRVETRSLNHAGRSVGNKMTDQEPPSPSFELGQLRRLNELLLRFLPVGVAVIDRSYHLLTANGTARRILGLREMGNEQDFLHAVRGIPYAEVRTAIDSAFREHNPVSLPEIELDISVGGNGRFVSLSIALMQMDAGTPDLAAVSVIDVTEQVQTRRQLETVQAEQAQLMSELGSANKRLNEVNKELLDANEELQVANEELVLTHEELQATIEEFETTNEELQATNEELETNNEELQATNEELETTNDELRARTAELQEMTTMLESERLQLTEMVELAPFYIMVLRGPNLIIEAVNSRFGRMLGGRVVQGRSLGEIFDVFWEAGRSIISAARDVYYSDSVRTIPRMPIRLPREQGEPAESYFMYTIVPTHDSTARVTGVVIYAADETEQRAREFEEERTRLRLIFEHANVAAMALYDAQNATLIMASPRYIDIVAHLHSLEENSVIGRKWHELYMVPSLEQAENIWNTTLESHEPFRLSETRIKLPESEKETIWDWTLTPILGSEQDGPVRFMLVSAIEITEQALAREEVERINELRDEFLARASHELRTPLTAIIGNAQLLQLYLSRQAKAAGETDGGQSSTQNLHTVDRMIRQLQRLNSLIDEMLDITRIRSDVLLLSKQQHVDIVELAKRVVEQYANSANRAIRLETQQETITGVWDEDRLEQVLGNLVSNAVKYSPSDTPVTVSITNHTGDVTVSVRDQGKGIREEDQTHIFDCFYRIHNETTSKVDGLGLGLYIANQIIVQHGGRMWIESKPGDGSTFSFSLPLES
jgi:two-component system, chemotaxis family, CheB/CheR fusion protein